MAFQALFVKFRESDNRPLPAGLPVQVIARTADEVVAKMRRLASAGSWPSGVDAVRIFEDGREIDSFIPTINVGRHGPLLNARRSD